MKKFFLSIVLYLFLSGCILSNAFLPQTYIELDKNKPSFENEKERLAIFNVGQLYKIKNLSNDKYLEILHWSLNDGEFAATSTNCDCICQNWKIELYNSSYVLINENSNKLLDVDHVYPNDELAFIMQWQDLFGISTQLWTITNTDDGYYLIKNNNSGMVLTTFNDGQTDDTLIVQTYYIGLNNQKWIIF